MDIAIKRIKKELAAIEKNKEVDGIYVEPIDDNFYNLRGYFKGSLDTPYQGGSFIVSIKISKDYPFNPPDVKFITKVWHPNVSSVTGFICLDILNSEWAAAITLRTILISLQALMCDPHPNDPQDAVVANQLLKQPEIFYDIAKQWTRLYASGTNSSPYDKIFDEKISELISMGIKKDEAIAVLCNNNLDVQKAVDNYFS